MPKPEIIIKLSTAFNQQVRNGEFNTETFENFYNVLSRYGAKIAPNSPHVDDSYFHVTETRDPNVDGLLKDLRHTPGVEAAYKKPPASCP